MSKMEHVVYLPSLASSYSALSLAERSEVISEVEEMLEVKIMSYSLHYCIFRTF